MLLLLQGCTLFAIPPEDHLNSCRDLQPSQCTHLKSSGDLNCAEKGWRRTCAKSCGACTRLIAPMQVGLLIDGVLPIPENFTSILLEIGSSDRNTMDVDMLPRMQDAFLVTAEPLIEKYSRALGRRRESRKVRDALEPLGQHHDRGFILPFAIAPVATSGGELRDLNVGSVGGCSSVLKPNRSRHRGRGGDKLRCMVRRHRRFR